MADADSNILNGLIVRARDMMSKLLNSTAPDITKCVEFVGDVSRIPIEDEAICGTCRAPFRRPELTRSRIILNVDGVSIEFCKRECLKNWPDPDWH